MSYESQETCILNPMDIESFVAGLPNIDELEQANNEAKSMQQYQQQQQQSHIFQNQIIIENFELITNSSAISYFNAESNSMNTAGHIRLLNLDELNMCSIQETIGSFEENSPPPQQQQHHIEPHFGINHNANIIENVGLNNQMLNISKVDLLNQILSNANNATMAQPINFDVKRCADGKTKATQSKKKTTKKNSKQQTRCTVCGKESSGFHYGSHTCEACKLFFRRTERRIRRTGFIECPRGNCRITSESRGACSQCRYKKCIAVGMSMGRSRYGRHTDQTPSGYSPDLIDSLCKLCDKLTASIRSTDSLFLVKHEISLFYIETLKLLEVDYSVESNTPSIITFLTKPSLSEISTILHAQNSNFHGTSTIIAKQLTVPNNAVVLLFALFDIESPLIDEHNLRDKLECFRAELNSIQTFVLKKNPLVQILRIGLFVKILWIFFDSKDIIELEFNKRIDDLKRSEFALFKYEERNSVKRGKNEKNHLAQINLGHFLSQSSSFLFRYKDKLRA